LLSISEARKKLLDLKNKNRFERMLQTAAVITQLLEQQGIRPVIVGGLSVEIYSMSGYTTQDIDFVLNGLEEAKDILFRLGFEKLGKDWFHPEAGVSVEIPSNTLTGDEGKITQVPVDGGTVYVIGIEDLILDRLRSAVHWKSGTDREWGYRLFIMYQEDLDMQYIESNFQHPIERQEFERWKEEANKGS
jgi:hypothetical protein